MEKEAIRWKIEALIISLIVTLVSLSLYASFLSLQALDETFRRNTVALAVTFLVAGMTVFFVLVVYAGVKKVFSSTQKATRSQMEESAQIAE